MNILKTSILTVLLLTFTSFLSAQNLTKTSINDNLDELFINKDNPYGSIPTETVDKYLAEAQKIYFFEVVYNDKVLFSEGIMKSIPQGKDSEIFTNQSRFKYRNIYLDADEIEDADKLKLLESYRNKIVEIGGKKLLHLSDYEIIKNDYQANKYVVQNPLENMEIKIYKVEMD